MKRVFILKKSWFDTHREEINTLEEALTALRLTEAHERADQLMFAALKAHEGIRLSDFELELLIKSGLEHELFEFISALGQVHVSGDKMQAFREGIGYLCKDDRVSATHAIQSLNSVLTNATDEESLILEDVSGF